MAIILKDTRKEFAPAPEELQQAVCCDVVELGLVDTNFGKKEMVQIRWQSEHTDPETGKHFLIMNRYNMSLNEKATLRLHLESWRGRKFTQEELQGFDLEQVITANCQIQVIHNITEAGRVFANIQAIVPMNKKSTKLRVMDDYVRVKDKEKSGQNGQATATAQPEEEAAPF